MVGSAHHVIHGSLEQDVVVVGGVSVVYQNQSDHTHYSHRYSFHIGHMAHVQSSYMVDIDTVDGNIVGGSVAAGGGGVYHVMITVIAVAFLVAFGA